MTLPDRRQILLTVAGEKSGGGLMGVDPRKVSREVLSSYYGAKNPLRALRERCIDCCCFQPAEVRRCVSVDCPSWPFRMGTNPFREKRVLTDEQKAEMAKRLIEARR